MIVVALLVGLVGLLMSVCGGVALFATVRSGRNAAAGIEVALLVTGAGVGLVWFCVNLIQNARENRPPRDED